MSTQQRIKDIEDEVRFFLCGVFVGVARSSRLSVADGQDAEEQGDGQALGAAQGAPRQGTPRAARAQGEKERKREREIEIEKGRERGTMVWRRASDGRRRRRSKRGKTTLKGSLRMRAVK